MRRPKEHGSKRIQWLDPRARAYSVHVLTASGIVFAFLAMAELLKTVPDPRWVFVWLFAAVVIDSIDGPLARRWDVKANAPRFAGETIDDIIDYLTYTFIPLLLVWRMGWVSGPAALWVILAMGVSLFGFSNTAAKQAAKGFFLGFPSYWNIFAFYAGIVASVYERGSAVVTVGIVIFAVLTITPVRFIYPNHAPAPWKQLLVVTGIFWALLIVAMLPGYPDLPAWGGHWILWISFFYPLFYFALSIALDFQDRQNCAKETAAGR